MSEKKYFTELNGFLVKDEEARDEIENLKESGGHSLYKHVFSWKVTYSDDPDPDDPDYVPETWTDYYSIVVISHQSNKIPISIDPDDDDARMEFEMNYIAAWYVEDEAWDATYRYDITKLLFHSTTYYYPEGTSEDDYEDEFECLNLYYKLDGLDMQVKRIYDDAYAPGDEVRVNYTVTKL